MTTMPRQKPHRSKQDYATPANFIQAVKYRLGITEFSFDFAADARNAKAAQWWGKEHGALTQSPETWLAAAANGWGWLNPPFEDIEPWVARCAATRRLGGNVAFLVPASVGSNWFRDYVHKQAQVLFLNGRLAFIEGKPDELYPKDCILVLFSQQYQPGYKVWTWKHDVRGASSDTASGG